MEIKGCFLPEVSVSWQVGISSSLDLCPSCAVADEGVLQCSDPSAFLAGICII